ncbi:MAG: hypothetical protein A3I77_06460 [Gammaproteobacteria bacterium RIFCSPLOWO2_02_FULL_42_14]|nr:MAG: hypothetical protein A3B71_06380 [Gammaproteobacteria bacterium RIFCSPHIGHO2_02_FULL_42_43]OGT52751.1 MAG: hypothetical protein A3E54_02560 [Gammaproteobacteria bacterium RIFCSPHIGHO2_12_FULL_41_25]OGT63287.1 MAG: hypothetical protein A3I77_06460 [Gammaproteobacteria bacterium RIFCSPLOWO2_02_FULL_42_14]OGT86875.1 MAG: hypothetical protein A3G86_05720 [Gammaproteobacteria bacterium RIFCSPLOWO2_12_FULL_42_18]
MVLGTLFNEFAVVLLFSVFFSMIAIRLYQPIILGFIAVGVVLGPSVFDWIHPTGELDLLAKIGITLLLFVIGLKLDFNEIRTLGYTALATGIGQIVLTAFIGYALAVMMGLSFIPAIYVAIALTFSSTIIIVKLLSDKNELDSLYGRIAIGYLIVQDIAAVIAIIVLSSMRNQITGMSIGIEIMAFILKSIGILTLVALMSRYLLPKFLESIAKSRELLVLFGIAWAIILAGAAESIGLSREVGGFLAGMSLASTQYRNILASRLDTLRNFLLLFFFLELGVKLDFHALDAEIFQAVLLSLFVLIGKPIVIMVIMGMMGYRKRTSFLTGITSAQISEFSLILASVGLTLNQINENVVGLITLVGIITFSLSTYMILYDHLIYEWCGRFFNFIERKIPTKADADHNHHHQYDVIIFGIGRYGETIANILRSEKMSVLGVDFDPEKIQYWHENHLSAHFGDAEDVEYLRTLPLHTARWVISTIPQRDTNKILLAALKEADYQGKMAISLFTPKSAENEKDFPSDLIFHPYHDAAEKAARLILADK